MKDQIINFETAKFLRDILNFSYSWDIPNWYTPEGVLNDSIGNEFYQIPAPTQTFVRKWLRENYDIHIVIEPIQKDKTLYEWTVISDLYEEEYDYEDDEYFQSYEEALESALQEGLNLIKSKK